MHDIPRTFRRRTSIYHFVTEPTRLIPVLNLVFADHAELIKEVTVADGLGNSDHNIITFYISESRANDNLHRVPNFNKADFG